MGLSTQTETSSFFLRTAQAQGKLQKHSSGVLNFILVKVSHRLQGKLSHRSPVNPVEKQKNLQGICVVFDLSDQA